ncbi:histidine phosphatase family protein [Rossellomorea marisflavi]|uniref:histidine phosphatase family protein n=1 Tax=Rossellomorea marisflavi TaxID=189381 RepID=UPI0025AFBBE6|nr:histidine phosphatase family protein [Rossellomorea marisflavi]WJV19626.1 histidine phosphatase family protein [Rossellomorea marisflavi]
MKTEIYFVRHAHSTYTPEELTRPLSEKGMRDARRVTRILELENLDHVVSSPFLRAVQTVEGTAASLNQDVILLDGFKERLLSSAPLDDFQGAIRKVWEEPSFHWEGGESNVDDQKRGVAAMLDLLNEFEGKRVVVGTHGNIMVLIMNHFDPRYGLAFWENLDMPDVYRLTFDGVDLVGVSRLWEPFSEEEESQ